MIYGAYGYTGTLVAEEAIGRGHRPGVLLSAGLVMTNPPDLKATQMAQWPSDVSIRTQATERRSRHGLNGPSPMEFNF